MKTIKEVMDMPVENLELSVRCINCLRNLKIKTLSELTAKSEEDFMHIRTHEKLNQALCLYNLMNK